MQNTKKQKYKKTLGRQILGQKCKRGKNIKRAKTAIIAEKALVPAIFNRISRWFIGILQKIELQTLNFCIEITDDI